MNYSQGVLPVISKTDSGFIDKKGNYIFKCKIYREPLFASGENNHHASIRKHQ